jgi:hypothetical protein
VAGFKSFCQCSNSPKANFWQPFAKVRTAAQMHKDSGFSDSEFPCHFDGPFKTYRTSLSSVTSLPEYASSGWTRPPNSLCLSQSSASGREETAWLDFYFVVVTGRLIVSLLLLLSLLHPFKTCRWY